MKALFLFHLHVGVRVAVRSFILLFASIIFAIMLMPNPAATITGFALIIFAPQPTIIGLLPVTIFAFLLPMLASRRLSSGMTGWIRHLSYSGKANKRGLVLALAMAQIPLWASLFVMGIIAHLHGYNTWHAIPQLCVLLAAGACTALPVHRRPLTVLLALSAAACSFSRELVLVVAGVLLLASVDFVSGDIRQMPRLKPRRSAESFFDWKIAWRALGIKLAWQYVLSLLIIGVMALFAHNSELRGSLLAATCRFGGIMATGFFISSLAARLAEKRPPWPWARSFPITSHQRVASDALFLGFHALPLLVPIAFVEVSSIWFILLTLPLISIRATGRMRRIREHRSDVRDKLFRSIGQFLECYAVAALVALLPWIVVLCIFMSVPAFLAARGADTRQKVSLWLEIHYIAAGDALNWSDR